MNFIGHLYVARWTTPEPAFGLGAMLPDFAGMAGLLRLGAVSDARVAAGVALHHRTDDVFHSAPTFVTLVHEAGLALKARGVERGPARAAAHVGIEMLIDGVLIRRDQLGPAYLAALSELSELGVEARPRARERRPEALLAPADTALRALQQRLLQHGIPYDYERPEAVTARLSSVLSRRPRLALSAQASAAVGSIMPDLKARVVECLPALLSGLAHGLSHRRCSIGITG